jgi:hypothetical protein
MHAENIYNESSTAARHEQERNAHEKRRNALLHAPSFDLPVRADQARTV